MKLRREVPDIKYSYELTNIIDALHRLQATYEAARAKQFDTESKTQDILHTIEFCDLQSTDRAKLVKGLSQIRQERRQAKNTERILQPVVTWLKINEKFITNLENLITLVESAENDVNGIKTYNGKTGVIEELLGDKPLSHQISDDCDGDNAEPHPVKEDEISPPPYTLVNVADAMEKTFLMFPVVIYHCAKKKKGCSYYYVFPGVDDPIKLHEFSTQDKVLNVNNQKLRNAIERNLYDALNRHRFAVPEPIDIEDIYPRGIQTALRLGNITENRIIYQKITAYKEAE